MTNTKEITVEGFITELLIAMDKADVAIRKEFAEHMEKNADSDYKVSDHDPTWTGIIDSLRLTLVYDDRDEEINNYIEFRPESKYNNWVDVTFSDKEYKDLLTEENYNKQVKPALTKWFQNQIDKEEYGGFYTAYPHISVVISGYTLEKEVRWDDLEDIKPDKKRREQVREYIKKCIDSKDYEEWKSVGENPSHLEVFWLYDQVDPDDIDWYFERIANFSGDRPYFSLFYPSWDWQVPEFVDEIIAMNSITDHQLQSFYDVLRCMNTALGGEIDEYDKGIDYLESKGFDPEAASQLKDESKYESLAKEITEKVSQKLPQYLSEYKNARKRTFIKENEDEDLPEVWYEEGYVLNQVILKFYDEYADLFLNSFDWEYDTPSSGISIRFRIPFSQKQDAEKLTDDEKTEILSELTAYINELVNDDKAQYFAPVVRVEFHIGDEVDSNSIWMPVRFFAYAQNENSQKWLDSIKNLHDGMLAAKEKPYSNFNRVLKAIWWHIYEENFQPMLRFMKDYYNAMDGIHFGSSMRQKLSWVFKYDCPKIESKKGFEKKKKKKNLMTQDEHDLFEFAAQTIIECDGEKLSIKYGHDLERIAKNATIIQPEEESKDELPKMTDEDDKSEEEPIDDEPKDTWYSELFDEDEFVEDIFREYRDENVEAVAGYNEDGREEFFADGWGARGWIAIKIIKENEEAYKQSIKFMRDAIGDDFPARCELVFVSDVKNYVPIISPRTGEAIYKDSGSQFWGNAYQYPALKDDIRDYVKLSNQKVNYISGDEMEEDDSTFYRPDFFAMAAVAIGDETATDLAGAFLQYAETIDIYYAQAIYEVLGSFFANYGITDKNAANLVKVSEYGFSDGFSDYLGSFRGEVRKDELELLIRYYNDAGEDAEYYQEMLDEA